MIIPQGDLLCQTEKEQIFHTNFLDSQIFTHDGSEIQATPQKPIHFGFDEPFLPFDVPYSPIAEISPSRNVVESFDSATLHILHFLRLKSSLKKEDTLSFGDLMQQVKQ